MLAGIAGEGRGAEAYHGVDAVKRVESVCLGKKNEVLSKATGDDNDDDDDDDDDGDGDLNLIGTEKNKMKLTVQQPRDTSSSIPAVGINAAVRAGCYRRMMNGE